MSQAIWITNGDQLFNQHIAAYLLQEGHRIVCIGKEPEALDSFASSLSPDVRQQLFLLKEDCETFEDFQEVIAIGMSHLDRMDVWIHGDEMIDEERLFDQDPYGLFDQVNQALERVFLWNKAAINCMMQAKTGQVLFPMIYDALSTAGYPASTVLNQGKISFMRCLSKELSAFKCSVNAVTFGFYELQNMERLHKKELQKKLEIFGLRPKIVPLEKLIPSIDIFLKLESGLVSGQNYHIGTGVMTNL